MRQIEDFGGFEKLTRKKSSRFPREATNDQLEDEQRHFIRGFAAWGNLESGHRSKPVVPQDVLVGDVLYIRNKLWKIEHEQTEYHPAVCALSPIEQDIPFLKGTDSLNVIPRYRSKYFFIKPTPRNGLLKLTAFKKYPRLLRFNSIKNYYPERHLGCVDEHIQERLSELASHFLEIHPDTLKEAE